ncbi:M20/M25/M40 family metallo-hydrolase [Caulobacter sp. 17J65-9]|uniref:M20/M25/M40 family metallo-hydrolase n=1 Tax=Caulobacter sp. 17J65-9 TaxID=2709382 RepID=UPI0032046BD5
MKQIWAGAATAVVLASVIGGAAVAAEAPGGFQPSADVFKGHVTFLADDRMLGRETGTPAYDLAATYVAAEFTKLGLKPAGDAGGYLQHVPLTAYRSAGQGEMTLTGADGKAVRLVYGDDYLPGADPRSAEVKLSAPVVFAGYGVVDPARGRDDFAGLDVKGKIVVFLEGAPKSFQTEERAHFSSLKVKRAAAAARGAVGVVFLPTAEADKVRPWANRRSHQDSWSMTWRDASGRPAVHGGDAALLGTLSLAGAAKLFQGAPQTLDAIFAAAAKPEGAPPRFALKARLAADLTTETRPVESENVVGMIEGSDPVLKNEYVVLSAHLDHVGVQTQADGSDGIHNGAMDNATGIASMLEAARGFVETGARPRRSVLFVAVTAEEKGLIGSEYFASNPTVPKSAMVADVNLDMPVLNYAFTDVVAFGAERSSLGPAVQHAAARAGVGLSPDFMPEQGLFTRSDHYRFVEQGVPSVFLMTGPSNGGEAAIKSFLKERYHRPGDDLNQPIDWRAGALFAKVNYEIARELADTPERPHWNKGDFFGELFGK